MEQQPIEAFYEEAHKRGITVGNIRHTERGVFVQFTPRKGNREGLHRTFRTLEAFAAFLENTFKTNNTQRWLTFL